MSCGLEFELWEQSTFDSCDACGVYDSLYKIGRGPSISMAKCST